MKTLSVRFNSREIEWLEKESKRTGKSKSGIVVEVLEALRRRKGRVIKNSFR